MPLPQRTEYSEALQNLRQCVSDAELRAGEPAANALGLPLVWSGNFADVYKVQCPQSGNTWAVKCFTRESPGLRERYREISAHLERVYLPFMVDFQYVEPGLRAGGRWVPFLKMRWVEGLTLNAYVGQHVDQPQMLRQLLAMWPKLATRLRGAGVAHGDLQHGNVLLVPEPETDRLSLKLVDYDGMFVPALTGVETGEVGHPAYQHPQRLREAIYNADIDRFSQLAIYTAIQGVIVGGGELWRRNDNGDNLLFREVDYQNPGLSTTLQQLWNLGDVELQTVTGHLILAAEGRVEQVSPLEELIRDDKIRRLTAAQQQHVERLLFPSRRSAAGPVSASVTEPSAASGAVVVTCVCGSRFQAAPALYGQDVSCPVCRATIRVPNAASAATEPDPLASLTTTDDLWTAELPAPKLLPTVPKPPPPAEPLSEVAEFLRRNWLPVSASSVGVLTILVLLVMMQWPHARSPEPPATATLPEAPQTKKKPPALAVSPFDATMAAEHQQRWAELLQISARETNSIGMQLTLIPGGEFLMGSPDSDRDAGGDEKPQHRVQITQPFYLGTYEVTQTEYERVMGTNPSQFKRMVPPVPVEMVSWGDAQTFCQKLSSLAEERAAGRVYRLPTEAEWEYACRAGSASRFCFGDDSTSLRDSAWLPGVYATDPVGQRKPNAWGLHDMHGNVWEWCQDRYGPYEVASSSDPPGPSSGPSRVGRGGAWGSGSGSCRSASRYGFAPTNRSPVLGFRVARSPSGQ
jgi:formylglycine-generating enzyme required for sulfatase activity/serine/threonine protein kinase